MSPTQTQICNLALAKIGDAAQMTSLSDGSAQANYCALYYPQALNVLLNEYPWSFATKTVALNVAAGSFTVSGSTMTCTMANHGLETGTAYNLGFSDAGYGDTTQGGFSYTVTVIDANDFSITVAAGFSAAGTVQLVNPFWRYAFVLPVDFFNPVSVHDAYFQDSNQFPNYMVYSIESGVLYGNSAKCVLVYISDLTTSTSLFSPLFVEALSVLLAAYLAGPMIKGDQGVAAAEKLMQLYSLALAKAKQNDSSSRRVKPEYVPAAIAARSLSGRCGAPGG